MLRQRSANELHAFRIAQVSLIFVQAMGSLAVHALDQGRTESLNPRYVKPPAFKCPGLPPLVGDDGMTCDERFF
jgi:hypothetical protein